MQKYIFIPNIQKFAVSVAFAYSPAESIVLEEYLFTCRWGGYAFQTAVGVPFVTVTAYSPRSIGLFALPMKWAFKYFSKMIF
ncbi:hypothetical protein [Treponema pedis]|uniref:Uncharacterized protein n=1 Tax=Treponema pedis str. T A4 TaxID=1291379 RepID=S6A3Y2_9SPIR|nr:hypothetical protein [Treponema pedis]AGT43946.1 hypothetical protein TPE_1451 [Treponema pedis str. T A4]